MMKIVQRVLRWKTKMQSAMPRMAALVLAVAGCLAATRAAAQTPSGEFNFARTSIAVSEYESSRGAGRSVMGALLTVTRTGSAIGRVSVDYSTIDTNTASCGDTNSLLAIPLCDFMPTAGTLVFDHLEMTKKIIVPVGSDGEMSGNKIAFVRLTNPQLDPDEALLSPDLLPPTVGTATNCTITILEEVEIVNQGTNFVLGRATYAVDEASAGNVTTVNVEVRLPSRTGGRVRILAGGSEWRPTIRNYSPGSGSDYPNADPAEFFPQPFFTDGTGPVFDPRDFTAFDQELTFGQNELRQFVTIQVTNDATVEFNEDISIRLEQIPGNEPPVGQIGTALVTILYDDQPAGALDREWNPDFVGFTIPRYNLTPGANNIVRAVAVQPDQKTIVGGDFTAYNSFPRSRIARINTDGSNDGTFDPGSGADDFVTGVAVHFNQGAAQEGKIVVVGGFSSMNNIQRNGIARLNSNGSLDTSFSVGSGANGIVRAVALQSDGKAVIVGEFTTFNGIPRNGIVRLNTDGSVDATFTSGNGPDGLIWSVAVSELPERKIYIGGEFLEFSGAYSGNVARLNQDGTVDMTFDAGGGTDGPVYALLPLSDGRLVIGGAFNSVDFASYPTVARLLDTGRLDASFQSGSGANGAVYTLALQPDGKVLAGGIFTSFNGTRRLGLTRLFVNGAVDTSFMDTAYNQLAGLVTDYAFESPNYVNSLAVQSDGAVMIGGSFYRVGGNFAERWGLTDGRPGAPAYEGNVADIGAFPWVWTRNDKRTRMNVARLVGGHTPGPGNISYAFSQNTTDEDAGIIYVEIDRLDGGLGNITAQRISSDNIAIAGDDYVSVNSLVQWNADSGSGTPQHVGQTIPIDYGVLLFRDNLIEGDESFFLSLTNPAGQLNLGGEIISVGTALGRSSTVVSITDDDFSKGVIAFQRSEYVTNEGPATLRVTVVRTNGSSGQVSVRYYTRNGTASSPSDYTPKSEVLTFGSGVTSRTFDIEIGNDVFVEPDEDFYIVLTNAVGGAVIAGGPLTLPGAFTNSLTARAVIIDNDLDSGKANFSSSTYSTNEGAVSAQITLVRLGGSVGQLSVSVGVTNGTATAGSDFTGVTNVVTWVNGDVAPKVVTVAIADDFDVEANETIQMRLFNPSVAGGVGTTGNATLTLLNDDFPGAISYSQPIYDADERGTNITVIVVRTGGAGGTVTANYSFANVSAVNGTDYVGTAGTLTFGPGITATNFDVVLLNNGLQDGERTATLSLGGFTGGASAGANPTATLRISDDESVNDLAGSLDTSFSGRAGGTNAIHSVVIQPDDKILIGGEFRTLNRVSRSRVGRLNADGTLDGAFNIGSGPNGPVRAMALHNEDRILIGGLFTQVHGTNRNYLARLLADGTLDAQFNPGAGPDNPVYAMAVQADGRVVIGGSFATVNGISRFGIAVLENNGVVSTTFNPGQGINGTVFAVAVQNDGKILVGGDFTTVNGVSRPRFARLLPNGSVDESFDPGGGPDGAVRAISVQADGKILLGGSFTNYNGSARGHLARVDSTGALDSTFMTAVEGGNADVSAIALQFDGKILVGGEFTRFNGVTRSRITRLNRNGKTDPAINFGEGANDSVNALAIQNDRKIILGGRFSAYDNQPRQFLARIHGGSIAGPGVLQFTASTYDVAENAGTATLTVKRRGGTSTDITVDYFSVADTATADIDYTNAVGTLTFLEGETHQTLSIPVVNDFIGELSETLFVHLTNATPGVSFGEIPTATLTIINDDSGIGFSEAFYTLNEGSIGGSVLITVVRTGATNGTSTVRYTTTNGTALAGIDYTAQSGSLIFSPGQTELSFSVPVMDDDIIEFNETFGLLITNVTGSAALNLGVAEVTIVDNDFKAGDLTFSAATYFVSESSGTLSISVLRTNGSTGVLAVEYQTLAGSALAGNDYVAQVGTLTFVEGQTNQTIQITILDDGSIEGDEEFVVTLSNPSGGAIITGDDEAVVIIVDEEFGPGSVDRSFDPGAGANSLIRSVAADAEGRVLVAGAFTLIDGFSRNYVARLETNGQVDASFDVGVGPNAFVSSVSPSPGGRVVIAGAFNQVSGVPYNRVARYQETGELDSSFASSQGLNAAVNFATVTPAGKILVGGGFSLPSRGVSRLQVDGTVDVSFVLGTGTDGPVHAGAEHTDGSVFLGGAFTVLNGEARSRVAKVSAQGLLDTSFVPSALTSGNVFSLAVQSDGKVLVAGDFTVGSSTNRVGIARLNSDGLIDPSFDIGTGANGVIYALGIASDGKVYIAGDFTTFNGTNRVRFARLNTDGSLDSGFDPGRGADNTIYSMHVLPDDNILIGGDFTQVSGVSRYGVARILGSSVAPSVTAMSAAGGQFHLALSVTPGRTYVLESSLNLSNWTAVATNSPTSVNWNFVDPGMNSQVRRFFRVRELTQ